ncbi:MAG TPA: hypothetical protein VIY54_07770 [Steroidobacteraceae bacterium]
MSDSMQFDEEQLRHEARRRVADGRLPCQAPQYMWAGAGDDQPCSLCDRLIGPSQIEYELQFNSRIPALHRFHRICHEAWELECIR